MFLFFRFRFRRGFWPASDCSIRQTGVEVDEGLETAVVDFLLTCSAGVASDSSQLLDEEEDETARATTAVLTAVFGGTFFSSSL